MIRIRNLVAVAGAVAAACVPVLASAPALAAESPVVTDCNAHGQLTHHYTPDQLRTALNTMPPTVKEYTNCYDVINSALLSQIGSSGGGGGSAGKSSGGSFLPVWLIIVLAVLIVGGGAYAALAYRRQRPAGSA